VVHPRPPVLWGIAAALNVGGSNTGRLAGLGLSGELRVPDVEIGLQAGSVGAVTIGSGGNLMQGYGDFLTVGAAGTGTLTVSGGGELAISGTSNVGQEPGGTGSLLVNGGGVYPYNLVTIDIGTQGSGLLSITGGGKLFGRDDSLELARLGGHAEVLVSGIGSLLQLDTLVGRSSAQVSVERSGTIDANRIDGGGALWSVLPQSVIVARALTLADAGTLRFTLSDRVPEGAGRVLADSLALDGTLALALADGFAPALGDSFQLLAWQDLTGRFDQLDLPELASGLRWDDSTLYTNGTLNVGAVSEPANALLLALGGQVLMAGRRMRRRRWPSCRSPGAWMLP
jgi:T5SS/PEP-CTERM-associated repeat protein